MISRRYNIAIVVLLTPVLFGLFGAPAARAAELYSCGRIREFIRTTGERMTEREARFIATRDDRLQQLAAREEEQERMLAEVRARQDAALDREYASLSAGARDDAERRALAAFRVAVDTALRARRDATDRARAAFRSGVRSAVAERVSAAESAVREFRDAVRQASARAEEDCAAAPARGPAVRDALRNDLYVAQEEFRAAARAIDGQSAARARALVEARRADLARASADFAAALGNARADLARQLP